ncbi:glycosyltransferase [Halocatena halophila]|uniref:glycosyltransferase n=1 Tax=Halocatena halophila TaxID=2814576 RepID=UPI002ED25545
MTDRPPVSVLLPTRQWTDSCAELAAQLGARDELLLIHDTPADPITDTEIQTPGVQRLEAGEPSGCSGKANAIRVGIKTARHDRLVWTDDDYHHPPDWLETMVTDYDTHGPVSEVPYFLGRDPLSKLLEPLYASAASLPLHLGNQIWGGAVVFERDDIEMAAFLDELGKTVSDDGLLMEYLSVTSMDRTRMVPIGGSIRDALNRPIRWTQILRWHFPGAIVATAVLAVFVLVAGVLFPLPVALFMTGSHLLVNEYLGVRQWTAILAYPSLFVFVPILLYGLTQRTFVWGGRRYRWRGKYDVSVIE